MADNGNCKIEELYLSVGGRGQVIGVKGNQEKSYDFGEVGAARIDQGMFGEIFYGIC